MKNISETLAGNSARANRQSNMEVLRILAMFLVLVVHADYFSLGTPSPQDARLALLPTIVRILVESLSICCVNVFVLLSGWFGIKARLEGLMNFLFQCLFFLVGLYALGLALGYAEWGLHGVAGCLCLLPWNWFIKAYLVLYILSPVLNSFVETASQKLFRNTLIGFFLLQSVYGWMTDAATFYMDGYTPLSFVGLYLLARYIRVYSDSMKWKLTSYPPLWNFAIYLGISLLMTVISCLDLRFLGGTRLSAGMFTYDNPLVVLSSLALLLCFNKLRFQHRVVNWVAASSFAVFLLHTNPNVVRHFQRAMQHLYASYDGVACLAAMFLSLCGIFVVAVLIDQIRKRLYQLLEQRIMHP